MRPIPPLLPLLSVVTFLLAGCAGGSSPTPASPTPGGAASTGASPSVEPSPSPSPSPSSDPSPSVAPSRVPTAIEDGVPYAPVIDPADFSTTIDNPYLPWTPGTTFVYDGGERIEVTVTNGTREVMGVTTLVIRDRVFEDGALIEDTADWYAQDGDGNVWYFGEDTAECEGGEVTDRDGAWEGGVDGALPGIAMLADPREGDRYRQESYPGVAEDEATIVAREASLETPAGTFDDILVTEDKTPLEPDLVEEKRYAAGVGQVEERDVSGAGGAPVVLVSVTSASAEPLAPAPSFEACAAAR